MCWWSAGCRSRRLVRARCASSGLLRHQPGRRQETQRLAGFADALPACRAAQRRRGCDRRRGPRRAGSACRPGGLVLRRSVVSRLRHRGRTRRRARCAGGAAARRRRVTARGARTGRLPGHCRHHRLPRGVRGRPGGRTRCAGVGRRIGRRRRGLADGPPCRRACARRGAPRGTAAVGARAGRGRGLAGRRSGAGRADPPGGPGGRASHRRSRLRRALDSRGPTVARAQAPTDFSELGPSYDGADPVYAD